MKGRRKMGRTSLLICNGVQSLNCLSLHSISITQNELAWSQETHYGYTPRSCEERHRLMATVVSTLIELDERGVAWITDPKVIEVARTSWRMAPTRKRCTCSTRICRWRKCTRRWRITMNTKPSLRQRFCARQSVPKPGLTRQKILPYGSGSRSGACCHKCCDID